MVAYELSLIIKNMSKGKLISTVKRTAEMIVSSRGYIEKIEFLGARQLPYRMTSHGHTYNRGNYFLINYHSPYENIQAIKDNCKLDLDIIRSMNASLKASENFICNLHQENLPPAYRADVSKMIKESEARIPVKDRIKKKRQEKIEKCLLN